MNWKKRLIRNLADCLMSVPHYLSMEDAYRIAFEHYGNTRVQEQ